MIELEDLPELHDPVLIAAFEGWNDAGEAASAVIEHLADDLGRRGRRGARPRGLLRLPGQPAPGAARERPPPDQLAHDPRSSSRTNTSPRPRTSSSSRASSRRSAGGRSPSSCMEFAQAADVSMVVTLGALHGRRRRTPGRSRSPRRPTARTPATGSTSRRAPTRAPPASSASSRTPPPRSGVPSVSLLGGRAALRRAQPVAQGHARAASAGSRSSSTRRSSTATSTRTPAPGSAASTSWRRPTTRSPSTSSRSRRPRTPPTCPRRAATRSPGVRALPAPARHRRAVTARSARPEGARRTTAERWTGRAPRAGSTGTSPRGGRTTGTTSRPCSPRTSCTATTRTTSRSSVVRGRRVVARGGCVARRLHPRHARHVRRGVLAGRRRRHTVAASRGQPSWVVGTRTCHERRRGARAWRR